jgi:hypothetical protein
MPLPITAKSPSVSAGTTTGSVPLTAEVKALTQAISTYSQTNDDGFDAFQQGPDDRPVTGPNSVVNAPDGIPANTPALAAYTKLLATATSPGQTRPAQIYQFKGTDVGTEDPRSYLALEQFGTKCQLFTGDGQVELADAVPNGDGTLDAKAWTIIPPSSSAS